MGKRRSVVGWIFLLILALSSCAKNKEEAKPSYSHPTKPVPPSSVEREFPDVIGQRFVPNGEGGIHPAMGERTPPVAATPSPSGQDDFVLIDRELKQLPTGIIAFNSPNSMNLQDTAHIQLLLTIDQSIKDLIKKITESGNRQDAQIKVSPSMEARLTGTDFQIVAITMEKQEISKKDITEWKWDIKPLKTGQHILHLTLSVFFHVHGLLVGRSIRTFDRKIIVNISPSQRASEFFSDNWQWLWAVILVPLGGYIWKKIKR